MPNQASLAPFPPRLLLGHLEIGKVLLQDLESSQVCLLTHQWRFPLEARELRVAHGRLRATWKAKDLLRQATGTALRPIDLRLRWLEFGAPGTRIESLLDLIVPDSMDPLRVDGLISEVTSLPGLFGLIESGGEVWRLETRLRTQFSPAGSYPYHPDADVFYEELETVLAHDLETGHLRARWPTAAR